MSSSVKRIYSIDVLRGLMATSVMVYHYSSWLFGGLDASNIWSRFGIYAVTIFYFISGFSLMFVYWHKKEFDFKLYMRKRFFRLAPLFYFVSILFLSYSVFKTGELDFSKLLLNFTFLFSVIEPSAYYSTGAWSIGNEMFFYTVLALILYTKSRFKSYVLISFISLVFFIVYRYIYLQVDTSLSSQWYIYINPLNHLFTFLIGCGTYFLYHNYSHFFKFNSFKLILLLVSSLFFFANFSGDRINLVVGIEALLLLFSSYCLFLLFISLNDFRLFSTRLAVYLGDISYSIYLVHPLCWFFIERFLSPPVTLFEFIVFWFTSITFTLLVCTFTYNYIEKPGIKFGHKKFLFFREKKCFRL